MILEPGDVLVSRGEHANFQVQFSEDSPRWWACHLDYGNSYLVLNACYVEETDVQFARMLPLGADHIQSWWFEGSFDDWCTLDKLG